MEVTVEVTLSADWLDTIHDGKAVLLELPRGEDAVQTLSIRGSKDSKGSVPTRVWWLTAASPAVAVATPSLRRWYKDSALALATRYAIAPRAPLKIGPR
jgi:hypothetical protein